MCFGQADAEIGPNIPNKCGKKREQTKHVAVYKWCIFHFYSIFMKRIYCAIKSTCHLLCVRLPNSTYAWRREAQTTFFGIVSSIDLPHNKSSHVHRTCLLIKCELSNVENAMGAKVVRYGNWKIAIRYRTPMLHAIILFNREKGTNESGKCEQNAVWLHLIYLMQQCHHR